MPRVAALSDSQKADLYKIWSRHSTEIFSNDMIMNDIANGGSSVEGPMMALDERSLSFIARMTTFFLHKLTAHPSSSTIRYANGTDTDADVNLNSGITAKGPEVSCAYDIFKPFIPGLSARIQRNHHNDTDHDSESVTLPPIIPRLTQGRHVVTIDHPSFLTEMEVHEGRTNHTNNTNRSNNANPTFGAFLYHKPSHGICVTNCAIALTLITLHRRARTTFHENINLNNPNGIASGNHNNGRGTHTTQTIPPESILIDARYQNVFPTIEVQDVKTSNAYKFISLQGRIIKSHPKRLRLLTADVMCIKCGHQFEHLFKAGRYELPKRCNGINVTGDGGNMNSSGGGTNNNINNGNNRSSGKKCQGQKFELLRRTAKYIDCQILKLQEEDNANNPNSTAGRAPRHIDLEVTHDLVDISHAGDCIRVAGVIQAINSAVASGRGGKRAAETSTYSLYMKANSIVNTTAELHERKSSASSTDKSDRDATRGLSFTEEQLDKITRVAHADHMFGPMPIRMAFPFDLLVRSLCPSIIGHDMVKAGILLGLLGGTPPSSSGLEDVRSGVSIRSNIHCLVVGDPGMGKSCLLLATTMVAARSVYVGGNTSTTTGLTVSLSKEAGGEIGIEAGALVLADQGVCCIDEFDKMAKANQDGLLEAMEQQQISIAKAGVVASLPARCCVIAAANPKQGKYNMDRTVAENLNVSAPLLSRFDLVFILQDNADLDQDKLVSGNIMNLYRRESTNQRKRQKVASINSPSNVGEKMTMKSRLAWIAQTQTALPADLIKDYITYAREYCMPKMTPDAAAVLKNYFMKLRYPEDGGKRNDSVPITTRQLEALIRLAQARAKACLREFVLKEDAEDVVELMRDSVNQMHMDSSGILDRTRGGVVGKSKRKQKKEFVDALRRSGQHAFSKDDFYRLSSHLDLPLNDFWALVDELRYCDQPDIRKGADGMYYLM